MFHQKAIDPNPLNIILVKSDSKGDRLLFRYPYAADTRRESRQHNRRKNPYSLTVTEDLLQSPLPQTSNISKGHLTGFTDEVLSTLFAVKAELCEKKFELKVNDVRFVGHPTQLAACSEEAVGGGGGGGGGGDAVGGGGASLLLIHLVFALRASASRSVVACYHDLSARLGVALRHEERRCGYLSRETRAMVAAHDEAAARPAGDPPHPSTTTATVMVATGMGPTAGATLTGTGTTSAIAAAAASASASAAKRLHHHHHHQSGASASASGALASAATSASASADDSPFDLILRRSALARDLRSVYEDLCTTGLVHVRVNKWIEVSFCLPQKVHQLTGLRPQKDFIVEPETINKCLASLRPYHGLLLLVEAAELLDSLPPDSAPALSRLVRVCSPLKSLQTLAADADLTLSQVFQLTGHLVYWGRAAVIYPLCESNVYVVAPGAPDPSLAERFSEQFPGMHLLQMLAEFSLPSSVAQRASPLVPPQQRQLLARVVVWLLRHRLLLQLHTYVNCLPTPDAPSSASSSSSGAGHRGGGRSAAGGGGDGSLRSTPDEQLSLSTGGGGGGRGSNAAAAAGGGGSGRAASESDLSSTLSDDGPPPACGPPRVVAAAHQPTPPGSGANASNTRNDHRPSYMPVGYYGLETVTNGVGSGAVDDAAASGPAIASGGVGAGGSGSLLLQEELLQEGFTEEERAAVLRLPAASYLDDLQMLVRLHRRGYLDGQHHLEEIMYLENLRRSTLLQLLDKFRDILITHETEDPAIAMLYPHSHS